MLGEIHFLAAVLLAPQEPTQATIQLPDEVAVTGHLLADFDGDGRDDLVLACLDGASGQRSLRRHARRGSGPAFASRPTGEPVAVDRDVVAFTFCDCRPAPGQELILLTSEQVVVAFEGDGGATRFERLARHRLVWPAADPEQVVPLPRSPIDFDRDGDTDLLLPQPDGWSVWLQQDGSFERRVELALPPRGNRFVGLAAGGGGSMLELAFGDEGGAGGDRRGPRGLAALVRTTARTTRSAVFDFDDNGLPDIVAIRNGSCFAALQAERAEIARRERPLPLPEDRLALLDPAFDVQFEDLDGDGRPDLLLTTSARRDDDVEVRVDWFFTRPDGSWDERAGRLRLQTLAAPTRLVDVDGDGRRDLVCVSVRTSAMRALTGDSATAIDAQLSVFRGDGSGFARPALVSQALPLEPGPQGQSEPFVFARPGTGGRPGAVLVRADGSLQLRPLAPRGSRLRLLAATARVAVPKAARIVAMAEDGAEVLVLAEREVRHVRLR